MLYWMFTAKSFILFYFSLSLFSSESCKQNSMEESFEVCAKLGPGKEKLLKTSEALKRSQEGIGQVPQELAGPHTFQALGCRGFNSLENTVLRRELQDYLLRKYLCG